MCTEGQDAESPLPSPIKLIDECKASVTAITIERAKIEDDDDDEESDEEKKKPPFQ